MSCINIDFSRAAVAVTAPCCVPSGLGVGGVAGREGIGGLATCWQGRRGGADGVLTQRCPSFTRLGRLALTEGDPLASLVGSVN